MSREDSNISAKSFSRSIEPVIKVGYMDGAADGQTSVFQSSFDVGYQQGLEFGLTVGFQEAMRSKLAEEEVRINYSLPDPRSINCHICVNQSDPQQNVVNLYNVQREKNETYLSKIGRNDDNK